MTQAVMVKKIIHQKIRKTRSNKNLMSKTSMIYKERGIKMKTHKKTSKIISKKSY